MKAQLAVDIGNTRMKWGRCDEARVLAMCSLPPDDPGAWEKQLHEWEVAPKASWAVAGVHPPRIGRFVDWLVARKFSAFRVQRSLIPLQVCVDYPDKVGLDRLLNAVAVKYHPRPSKPAIIVDVGSAVTVDYLDEEGNFRGGAIFPGLRLMAQALNAYTAQLPVVEVQRRLQPPETSTERAIELGVFHAVLGGIELLIRALHAQALQPVPIFFGGGDATLLAGHLPWPVTIWPEMTLEGIRIAAEQLSA